MAAETNGYTITDADVIGHARSAGNELYDDIVVGFNGFNWLAIVEQPTEVALAPIRNLSKVQTDLAASRKNTLLFSAIAIIVIALIAVVLARMLSNRIISPLSQLQDAAERVAKGDTTRPISIESNDEIEDLAKIFDRMRNSVAILLTRYRKMQSNRSQA